jgi:hypothetical protein
MCCKVIYPGEPPWGLANSCCMAPIHFWPPNQWPRVEAPLHICAPPSVPCWPPAEGPTCSEKRAFFLVYRLRSQPASVVWPPFTFVRKLWPGFKLFSMCMCQAQGCCCRRRRGWSSWKATQGLARCCPIPDPHSWLMATISPPTSAL